MLHLNMPVVLVQPGAQDENGQEELRSFLESKLDNSGGVVWCTGGLFGEEGPTESVIEAISEKVHSQVGSMQFPKDREVRIVVTIRSDDPMAMACAQLCRSLRDEFERYFTTQCLIDLFLVLNQTPRPYRKVKEEYQRTYLALKAADDLARENDINGLWVISNADSKGVVDDDNFRKGYLAQGYYILLQAAECENTDKRFQYISFLKAINSSNNTVQIKKGNFGTIGLMHYEPDMETARLAALGSVYEKMQETRDNLVWDTGSFEEEIRALIGSAALDTRSLKKVARSAKKTENSIQSGSVGKAVADLFGRNIELTLKLNAPDTEELRKKGSEITGALGKKLMTQTRSGERTIAEAGQYLQSLIERFEKSSQDARILRDQAVAELQDFEKQPYTAWRSEKKRHSGSIGMLCDDMAEKLTRKMSQEISVMLQDSIAADLRDLKRKYDRLGEFLEKEKNAVGAKLQGAMHNAALNPGCFVCAGGADKYYGTLMKGEFSSADFARLKKAVAAVVEDGGANFDPRPVSKLCEDFTKNIESSNSSFSRGLIEELPARLKGYGATEKDRVKTPDDAYDLALSKIFEDRVSLMDATFFGRERQEAMVFFQSSGTAFAFSTNEANIAVNNIRDKNLKIFKTSEEKQLDVLMVVGNIPREGIFQFDEYEKAYNELMGESSDEI